MRDIFPWNEGRPLGIYYRPKVSYSNYTQLYVLWVNRVERNGPFGSSNFLNVSYVVATSGTPVGSFQGGNSGLCTLGIPGFVSDSWDFRDPSRTLKILIIREEHHLLYLQFQSGSKISDRALEVSERFTYFKPIKKLEIVT